MKKIPLTQNKFAIVDDEDFNFLDRFSWYYSSNAVTTRLPKQNNKPIFLEMWRLLVDTKNTFGEHWKKEIRYKDKDSLNLQKSNLDVVDIPTTLHSNRKRTSGNNGIKPTSLYKGVSCRRRMTRKKTGNFLYTPEKSWRAEIVYKGEVFLKYFATEKQAALWYNEKAREFYGEFAYQNIIEDGIIEESKS